MCSTGIEIELTRRYQFPYVLRVMIDSTEFYDQRWIVGLDSATYQLCGERELAATRDKVAAASTGSGDTDRKKNRIENGHE